MKKEEKLFRQLVDKLYPDINSLEVDDFFNIVGNKIPPWIHHGSEILFPAMEVSRFLGKYRTDYSANWHSKKKDDVFRGISYRFDMSELADVRNELQDKYNKKFRLYTKSWFLNWTRSYDYIIASKSTVRQIAPDVGASISSIPGCNQISIALEDDVLYLDSRLVANQLDINHESLMDLMNTYKNEIEKYGPLITREEGVVNSAKAYLLKKYYMLSENQAYLLGTLCRNTKTAVAFKQWLVDQFDRARRVASIRDGLEDLEMTIQRQLCELSLYTSINVKAEYPLEVWSDNKGKLEKTTRRIDLLFGDQIGIELKKEKISNEHIVDVIGTRGYYQALKRLPNFKYLIISSPLGVTHTASKMFDVLYPKVIFLTPFEIGEKLAEAALKVYPKESHWWLKTVVFPKLTKVLSPTFLSSLTQDYLLPPKRSI